MPARPRMLLDEVHRWHVADDAEVEALDEVQELAGQGDLLRGIGDAHEFLLSLPAQGISLSAASSLLFEPPC